MITTPDHTTSSTGSAVPPQGRQVSITEAARLLGVSGETIRRKIHAGELEAVRAVRPRGAWRVAIPSAPQGVECGGHTAPHDEAHQEPAPSTDVDAGSSTDVEGVEPTPATLAQVVAQLAGAVVALTGQLEAARVDVANLREERGRLTAELERAASALVTAEGALSASDEATASERRRARLLGLLLATLAVLALVGVVVGTLVLAGRMS